MERNHCSSHSGTGVTVLAFMVILAGVLLLLNNFDILWIERVWDLWPLALIAAGLAELLQWSRQQVTGGQDHDR